MKTAKLHPMRILNAVAALSGLAALVLLVVSSHRMPDAVAEQIENLRLAAFLLMISAAACVAIANRHRRLNAIAGALIVGGSILFAIAVASHVLANTTALLMLAPAGGVAMMLGWLALAFAPTKRPE